MLSNVGCSEGASVSQPPRLGSPTQEGTPLAVKPNQFPNMGWKILQVPSLCWRPTIPISM